MARAIVLDTETTGLDPLVDQLVEIAAIDLTTDQQFSSLCNPNRHIPPEVSAIHHIVDADVKGYPSPDETLLEMLAQFDYPEILIAHNAKFDAGMIASLLPVDYHPQWLCTYRNALVAWPDAPNHKNQTLRYWRGLQPQVPFGLAPHRALYDIIVTREIMRDLLAVAVAPRPWTMASSAIFNQMLFITENPILLKKIGFGKHAGKSFKEIDSGYLNWITKQSDMDSDVVYTARKELEARR